MQEANSASHKNLLRFEQTAWTEGYCRVAGIDEVGRGPIAGPVVAAAVIFPRDCAIPEVADSKALTAERRETLYTELTRIPGILFGIAEIPPATIDLMNILRATYAAMQNAVAQLSSEPDYALVDGRPGVQLGVPTKCIVKGDARSASIAAASIIAKVSRDRMMTGYDSTYPGYGFALHKGYATRDHLEALHRLGPCPIHRISFAPVSKIVNGGFEQMEFNFPDIAQ